MRCDRARALMDRYANEGLWPHEREPFEIHLRDCRICQQRLDDLQRLLVAFLLMQQWWDNAMTGVPGVRKDDEDQPGEAFVFELADDGTVRGFKRHSNWYPKVR